jgi:hypothetical protein
MSTDHATEHPATQDGADAPAPQAWASLIERMLKGLETGSRQWPVGRRKDTVQRMLVANRNDSQRLRQRLEALVASWKASVPALPWWKRLRATAHRGRQRARAVSARLWPLPPRLPLPPPGPAPHPTGWPCSTAWSSPCAQRCRGTRPAPPTSATTCCASRPGSSVTAPPHAARRTWKKPASVRAASSPTATGSWTSSASSAPACPRAWWSSPRTRAGRAARPMPCARA